VPHGAISIAAHAHPNDRNKESNNRNNEENIVPSRLTVFAILAAFTAVTVSGSQYPMLDMVAQKVIQRYESSTCEQLWEARGKPKTPEQQNMIQILQSDPQMRTAFLNEVAAPIANKMFTCGMIP
jgi:hypothetical protein